MPRWELLSGELQRAGDVRGRMPLIEQLTTAMPDLRVIVFSGLANSDEVSREAKRRGAAAYVSKGCDIQILFDALRTPATAS